MRLYLVRHGEAKSEKEDPERGLTERGVQDVRRMAAYAKRTGVRVTGIVHSPKARARQTAQLFAEEIKPAQGIDRSDNLLPNDEPGVWALGLAGREEDVMLVGHLPHLTRLASLLLCGDADRISFGLTTAGVLCLKREEGRWGVLWMMSPETVCGQGS